MNFGARLPCLGIEIREVQNFPAMFKLKKIQPKNSRAKVILHEFFFPNTVFHFNLTSYLLKTKLYSLIMSEMVSYTLYHTTKHNERKVFL